MPLSQWGTSYRPPPGQINADWDMKTPPTEQVEKLSPAAYFSLFTELTMLNPPHANDYPILNQMRRMGIEPGKPFAFDQASTEVQRALTEAAPAALKKIKAQFLKAGIANEGWRTNLTAVGTYGADYFTRAGVAFAGLGANTIEDAVYPTAITDAAGKPFSSDNRYVLHFNKDQIHRCTASGRLQCTMRSKPSQPTRLTAMLLAIAISFHSIPMGRSTFISSVIRPAKIELVAGPQAALSQ